MRLPNLAIGRISRASLDTGHRLVFPSHFPWPKGPLQCTNKACVPGLGCGEAGCSCVCQVHTQASFTPGDVDLIFGECKCQ